MDRDTGTTYEAQNISQCPYTLDSGNTIPCASLLLFSASLMFSIRTCVDVVYGPPLLILVLIYVS